MLISIGVIIALNPLPYNESLVELTIDQCKEQIRSHFKRKIILTITVSIFCIIHLLYSLLIYYLKLK